MNFSQITLTFLQHFQNSMTFSLHNIIFSFSVWLKFAFIMNKMSFLHFFLYLIQSIFSFTFTFICFNYDFAHFFRIVNEHKSQSHHQCQFQLVHNLNLHFSSNENLTLFKKNKDWLCYNCKVFDSDLIIYVYSDEDSDFCNVLAWQLVHYFWDFCCFWMSSLIVA